MNQTRSITGASPQPGQFAGQTPLSGGQHAYLAGRKIIQRQTSEPNPLLDAASELTQAFAARAQQRGIKERTILTGGALAGLSREVRQKTLEHTRLGRSRGARSDDAERDSDDSAAAGKGDLARAILSRPELLRQLADDSDGDATARFMLLLDALEDIESGQAGVDAGGLAASAVREVLEDMFAEEGEKILSDVNTVEVYSRLSADQAREFRSAYQDVALGADSLGAVVGHLLRLAGASRAREGSAESAGSSPGSSFADIHRAMVAALGLDLAAARPSTDRVKLQALVSDLYHLEVIGTLLEAGSALSGQLASRHGTAPFAAHQLTADLVNLSGERWVDADHFKRLADRYRAMQPLAATVDFLTGARNLIKDLPVKVFATPESRQSLIDAAQDAIDYAIDREEGIVE